MSQYEIPWIQESCKEDISLQDLSRKTFPCKILQEKNSLQELSRKTFPCKIFQGKHFLARSCKKKISLQDLVRHVFFARILQDPCKVCIHSQPGQSWKIISFSACSCESACRFMHCHGKSSQEKLKVFLSKFLECSEKPLRLHLNGPLPRDETFVHDFSL